MKQLSYILFILIITSCSTQRNGTLFSSGFYGKNKVVDNDNQVENTTISAVENETTVTSEIDPSEQEKVKTSVGTTSYNEEHLETTLEGNTPSVDESFSAQYTDDHLESVYQPEEIKPIKSDTQETQEPDPDNTKAAKIILFVLLGLLALILLFFFLLLIWIFVLFF